MSTSAPATSDPFDHSYWQRVGADGGRRNEPRTSNDRAVARSLLVSAWLTQLRSERTQFLAALDALNKQRTNSRRNLHDVHAQAAADPRQAAALSPLMEKDHALAIERALLCERYLQAVETLTQRARECDAVWISANEQHRDRRLSIAPTELSVPASLLSIPPDPFS